MEFTDSVIYYDNEKQLYNFPFVVKFTDMEKSIDFFFSQNDFDNQEEMSRCRINHCSRELFRILMKYFESLQVICLEDSNEPNDSTVGEINSLLAVIFNLLLIIKNIHSSSDVYQSCLDLNDELLEMFLLLEDYYTVEKKQELYEWKHKFMNVEKN
jgi:hypothetical protein